MASCLAPDFPAVMVALEHLKELDKQLKEDGIPFSSEASLHLREITAAITELEGHRRSAHENLEVETIENGKLRHQINSTRERMNNEIMADLKAARALNAEEMEQLHRDLIAVSQLQEAAASRQEALLRQNEALCPQRDEVKAAHDGTIAALNDQITIKFGFQSQLNHTQEQIEEMKSCIAAVQQDLATLTQNMVQEREVFALERDGLSREVEQAEGKINHRKQAIRKSRKELDRINDKKQESFDRLGELTINTARLESNSRKLSETLRQCEEQMEGEIRKHEELRQRREALRTQLWELGEALNLSVQRLAEEIASVEATIEEGRASRSVHQDSLAEIYKMFRHQSDEEGEVKAEYLHVAQQLERSKLQLEKPIASIVGHGREIKEMDKKIAELLENNAIHKLVFERNREEMSSDVETEKRSVGRFEEEKRRLTRLLEEARREQEKHVAKMASDIDGTRRRYKELQQERTDLQQRQPKSVDVDLMMSHMIQCEEDFRQKEAEHHQEMELCAAEIESIRMSNEEKLKEVQETEERLKEVETTWREEKTRQERVKAVMTELREKKDGLELWIEGLKEKTSSLLRPKEELKARLEEMREGYTRVLSKQASELRAVEVSIYDHRVKLEQVGLENSRLHLCIRRMTEAVCSGRQDRRRYRQEIRRFKQDTRDLCERLRDAWREDSSVTQSCQSGDGVLVVNMSATMRHLMTRRQQLGSVDTLLLQQMQDFSRRLGDRTVGVSADM